MRRFRRTAAALTLSTLAFSACSGTSSTPLSPIRVAPTATASSAPASADSSSGFAYDAAFVHEAQLVGPANFGSFGIDVVLRMQNPKGIVAFAQAASDPKSGSYRQFLTPQQIADKYGATVADQNAAIAYFHRYGLWVSGWKQRMMIHVSGTQAQLSAAFHTTFGQFRAKSGELFYAPESAPSVAPGVPVLGSANIVYRTKRYSTQFVSSKGVGSGYSPEQIAAAFDYDGAYAAGYTGSGVTIGVIGTGPVVVSGSGMVGDADAYRSLYKVGGSGSVTLVPTTGSDTVANGQPGFAPPPPVTNAGCGSSGINPADGLPYSESPTSTCNPEDGEAQLDTEQTSSLARDASVQFYLAYNPSGCINGSAQPVACASGDTPVPLQGLVLNEEELQTIIDHNTADVVSGSFGGSEPSSVGNSPPAPFTSDGSGLDPTEYAMMVAEGMTVFISSGDTGAEACQATGPGNLLDSLCVNYPASDPSVTGAGGVTAPINAAGQIAGPVTAWGVQTSGGFDSASGGGVSEYFTQPSYQTGAPGILGSMRNVPDLALDGDPETGVATLAYADPSFGGAELFDIGGTSVAAPEAAAMWALVVSACKQSAACTAKGSGAHPYRLGNANPVLYQIYASAASYGSTFLTVSYGDNADVQYCANPNNAGSGACPSPSPGTTAAPSETAPPLDPGYSANPNGGYNQLTGLGVPFGRALIRAVVGV